MLQRQAPATGMFVIIIGFILNPLSAGIYIDIDAPLDCLNCKQLQYKNPVILDNPYHNFTKQTGHILSGNIWDYSHTIEKIGTPYAIANAWGEYVTFEIHTITQGTFGHRVYITLWCDGELYSDWVSDYMVIPGINGLNIYPYHITKVRDTDRLNFTVETGHIRFLRRVKDDYQEFSIPIGIEDAVPDQICSLILRSPPVIL